MKPGGLNYVKNKAANFQRETESFFADRNYTPTGTDYRGKYKKKKIHVDSTFVNVFIYICFLSKLK